MPSFTQVNKRVQTNSMLGDDHGVEIPLVASCKGNRDISSVLMGHLARIQNLSLHHSRLHLHEIHNFLRKNKITGAKQFPLHEIPRVGVQISGEKLLC